MLTMWQKIVAYAYGIASILYAVDYTEVKNVKNAILSVSCFHFSGIQSDTDLLTIDTGLPI